MITEDYVSFEIAKLLKEKGFTANIHGMYDHDGKFCEATFTDVEPYYSCYAPTLQMVMKWLREVHMLSIEPYYDLVLSWVVDVKHIGKHTDTKEFEEVRSQSYNSYEQACEAAIKYCLENLI